MADRLQLRNDITANWELANPILAKGEFGIEVLDVIPIVYKIKIGDVIERKDFDFNDTEFSIENLTDAVDDFTGLNTGFNIYPNPVQDYLNISYNVTEFSNNFNIEVIDIMGRIIQLLDYNTKNNEGILKLNLTNVPPGIYFCTINSDNKEVFTFKLIKH